MVFTKLEHTILTSLEYADFKDENGELYLKVYYKKYFKSLEM